MRILQVNKFYSPWIGGIETIVQQLTEGLKGDDRFETEVLCCGNSSKSSKEVINGIKVTRAGSVGVVFSMPLSISFFSWFKKMAEFADIIDIHHPFPLSFLAYCIFRPRARLIIHYHSDIVRQKFFNWLLAPIFDSVLGAAETIIVSSPNLVENSPLLNKYKSKCCVIHFGINLPELDAQIDEEEIANIKKSYGDFVLFVGRLSYYKGVEFLLEAIAKLKVKLVIVGDGSVKKDLLQSTKNLGITDRVVFLPHLDSGELINFYKAAKIFILPSIFKSEAFGLVILDAMAVGTPVISTEIGTGTSYVNINGQTGIVVQPKNSEELAKAISEMLNDEKKLITMGATARQRVEDSFTLASMIINYKKLLG